MEEVAKYVSIGIIVVLIGLVSWIWVQVFKM